MWLANSKADPVKRSFKVASKAVSPVKKVADQAEFFSGLDDQVLLDKRLMRQQSRTIKTESDKLVDFKPLRPLLTFTIYRVSDLSNFWRRAALSALSEKAPQITTNPEWYQNYAKERNVFKEKSDYWKQNVLEQHRSRENLQRPTRDRMLEKEREWRQNSENKNNDDDSKIFASCRKKSDVEVLCELIFDRGEKYEDGTAAIEFQRLRGAFARPNLVGCLAKAKKFGIVYYDGEILGQDEDDFVVLRVPVDKVKDEFEKMRQRVLKPTKKSVKFAI